MRRLSNTISGSVEGNEGRQPETPCPDVPILEPVFTGRQKIWYSLGLSLWLATLLQFWTWWLDPAHVAGMMSYAVVTLAIAWVSLVPLYFILIFRGARRVRHDTPLPAGRVALVVTKAPSEPFSVVRRTLTAMLAQRGVSGDVWLADEDPDDEARAWCRAHGVRISTRKGLAGYHCSQWPRRTRCKEGNLAYFYDRYGYEKYDFVAQFDADHVPEPDYLCEALKPFCDPRVGYVSAPSICDANAASSWSARGRLYAEAPLHGALQLGYNNGWAPLCIGSHYTVRTKALKQIGGLGPELAEDHSTTLMMNAGGWRGVHAVDAIAHGDGPQSFADLAIQEFQWSRSLVTILLQYGPPLIARLPARLKFQFLFAQLWYPLFSLFMLLSFVLPLVPLIGGQPLVAVTYPQFLLHFLPVSLVLIGLAAFWRATGTYRPHDAKIFGWEGIAFVLLRWPWSLAGSLAAVRDAVTQSFVDFRITPKGGQQAQLLPVRLIVPYVALAVLAAGAMVIAPAENQARGFYVFVWLNVVLYTFGAGLIVACHARENGWIALPRSTGFGVAMVASVLAIGLGNAELGRNGLGALEALGEGQKLVSFTRSEFTVAGAGFGGQNRITKLRIRLNGFAPRA